LNPAKVAVNDELLVLIDQYVFKSFYVNRL